ncbi:hypothetical protein KJ713_00255 [Patescibacteria group bacterium]|nr:hypothetical protein [Patescibacteria group bacterium]
METESSFVPEQERSEPTVGDIVKVCQEALGDDEVAQDFDGLYIDEALGHAFSLLIENDIDPDELFRDKGIIEG